METTKLAIDDVKRVLDRACSQLGSTTTPEWTVKVLGALAALGVSRGLSVDPVSWTKERTTASRAGEALWDLTLSTWPKYDEHPYRYPDYFDAAAKAKPRLVLVAESEWGSEQGAAKHGHAVMDDFTKLLAARAPLKVMVFAHHTVRGRKKHDTSFEGLRDRMARLVASSGDDADYLLYARAWDGPEAGAVRGEVVRARRQK